jgi:hypothetical protein
MVRFAFMTRTIIIFSALLFFSACGREHSKTALEKFEQLNKYDGGWKVTHEMRDGKEQPTSLALSNRLVFKGEMVDVYHVKEIIDPTSGVKFKRLEKQRNTGKLAGDIITTDKGETGALSFTKKDELHLKFTTVGRSYDVTLKPCTLNFLKDLNDWDAS